MPGITTAIIDRLIDAFAAKSAPAIVLPTVAGKRGNPVLWARAFFPELMAVTGDTGARHILARHEEAVERVEIGAAAPSTSTRPRPWPKPAAFLSIRI